MRLPLDGSYGLPVELVLNHLEEMTFGGATFFRGEL